MLIFPDISVLFHELDIQEKTDLNFTVHLKQLLHLWPAILKAGESEGVVPAGLGARDTLRFEAGLPLYGQELSKDISPLEAGLGFVVKLNKEEDFIGKEALASQKENGVPRKLVGIEMIDKGIPRTGYKVFIGEEEIGEVTTGTQSPTLKKNIGFALIEQRTYC